MSNMVVNTNVLALNSHRALKNVGQRQAVSSGRLSSGLRINSAADDAAGLAISEKMRAQIRGLDMASRNSQDAISLIQTAEGGMQEVQNMLQRMRELIDFAANDTNEESFDGTGDRQKVQDEIDQLTQEIDSIAGRVEFNTKRLIDGSFADTRALRARNQVAADNTALQLNVAAARATALGEQLADDQVTLSERQSAFVDAQSTFRLAQNTFTGVEVRYNRAREDYNRAFETLRAALVDTNTGAVDLQTLVDRLSAGSIIIGTGTGGTRLSDTQVRELQRALVEYARAASVYGSDRANLGGLTNAEINRLDSLFGVGGGGMASMSDVSGVFGAAVNFLTTNNAALSALAAGVAGTQLVSGTMRAEFSTASATFLSAQISFDQSLAARDMAASNVASSQGLVDEAIAEMRTANTLNNATTRALDAAIGMDDRGGARALFFQVGANANQSLINSIGSVNTDVLGIGNGRGESAINVVRASGSQITSYLSVMDRALSYVSTERSKLGATQNRLEFTMRSLDISSENLSASESRVRDADMAREMMSVTAANVLQQAAISMLAQANQAPQAVLQLL